MSENTYFAGGSVRLKGTFVDYDDVRFDPTLVKVIMYDEDYVLLEEFTLTETNKITTGEYFYDYTIDSADTSKRFVYEWYGELDTVPYVNRGSFMTKFK